MSRRFATTILAFILSLFLSPVLVFAQAVDCVAFPNDPSCARQVTVTAQVASRVSATLSSVTADLRELPADGTTSVLVTVEVINLDSTPAANRDVTLSTVRGNVDVIHVYRENNLELGSFGQTDENGIIRFTIRSRAPGITIITAVADTVTLNDRPSVTFTPLPILQNIIITVPVPGVGDVTIVRPPPPRPAPDLPALPDPEEPLIPGTTTGTDQLVNNQLELRISFWWFILLFVLLAIAPTLFIWVTLLVRRIRKLIAGIAAAEEKENSLLQQIYALEMRLAEYEQANLAQGQAVATQVGQVEANLSEQIKETNESVENLAEQVRQIDQSIESDKPG